MHAPLVVVRLLHLDWVRTGDANFPVAAELAGSWWVLRMNGFPEHPLWTVFANGDFVDDLDDLPEAWGQPLNRTGPEIGGNDVLAVMAPYKALKAYGSERGEPCDDPYCCGWD